MPTRITAPDDDNWESSSRSVTNRRGSEKAQRIAFSNHEHEDDDYDDAVLPARQRRQRARMAAVQEEAPAVAQTATVPAATTIAEPSQPPVVAPTPAPIHTPAAATAAAPSPNVKKKKYNTGANTISKTYNISTLANMAMNICGKKTGCTKSAIMHEALRAGLDAGYYEKARIYDEIQTRFKNGEPLENLVELRNKLGTVIKKTRQPNMIDGTTIKVCLVADREDVAALDFFCKEVGLSYGTALDQCLRAHLAEYLKEADEWLAFMGI